MVRRGKRWSVPGEVEATVRGMLSENRDLLAKEVWERLHSDEKLRPFLPDSRRRTIERLVGDIRKEDRSGPWTLGEADPDDAPLILPVLAEVMVQTSGRAPPLTKAAARWIARLSRAVPGLPPMALYHVARAYAVRKGKESTADLDLMLGLAPWRGERDWDRFEATAKSTHPGTWPQLELLAIRIAHEVRREKYQLSEEEENKDA